MQVLILGSNWEIVERSAKNDPRLSDCDGYCDWTTKTIVAEREHEGATLANMDLYVCKVIRHEIVHAFLFESGLAHASCSTDAWAVNEEMVDWFARMGERIYRAWKDAGALGGIDTPPTLLKNAYKQGKIGEAAGAVEDAGHYEENQHENTEH